MRWIVVALVVAIAGEAAADDACARGTRWKGRSVDVDVKRAPIEDVVRMLGEVGRVNVVLGDGVKGAVTVKLRAVPWDHALCVVAKAGGLQVTVDRDVWLVMR